MKWTRAWRSSLAEDIAATVSHLVISSRCGSWTKCAWQHNAMLDSAKYWTTVKVGNSPSHGIHCHLTDSPFPYWVLLLATTLLHTDPLATVAAECRSVCLWLCIRGNTPYMDCIHLPHQKSDVWGIPHYWRENHTKFQFYQQVFYKFNLHAYACAWCRVLMTSSPYITLSWCMCAPQLMLWCDAMI